MAISVSNLGMSLLRVALQSSLVTDALQLDLADDQRMFSVGSSLCKAVSFYFEGPA